MSTKTRPFEPVQSTLLSEWYSVATSRNCSVWDVVDVASYDEALEYLKAVSPDIRFRRIYKRHRWEEITAVKLYDKKG